MRLLCPLLLVMVLGGCATQPVRPSTVAERTPTPGTVNRDNPAGDAHSPVDAALSRLEHEPLGTKVDKFRTLKVRFPDFRNWTRVRFWGYPTRAGFRYGDDGYALALVLYTRAEQSDEPAACLDAFLHGAVQTAHRFDIGIGPMSREEHEHYRGPESVDWEAWERERQRKLAEHRRRLERLRQQRRAGNRALVLRRRRSIAARLARLRALATAPPAQPQAAPNPAPAPAATTAAAAPAVPPRRAAHQHPSPPRPAPPTAAERRAEQWRQHERRYGKAPMPVTRVSGRFKTLLNSDRYLGAIAAYRSWPGTCLVEGFTVKIGSDEALARRVVDRWIAEIAPKTLWVGRLRTAPQLENR